MLKIKEQTNEAYTARELAENHLFMALRTSRAGSGILTLEDIARIIRESLGEDAEFVGKKLLIKEN
jgi:hypothetical protein